MKFFLQNFVRSVLEENIKVNEPSNIQRFECVISYLLLSMIVWLYIMVCVAVGSEHLFGYID